MCTLVATEERLGGRRAGRMAREAGGGPDLRLGNEWPSPRTLMPHVTDQDNRLGGVSTCSVLKLQVAVREQNLPSQLDREKGATEEEPGSH